MGAPGHEHIYKQCAAELRILKGKLPLMGRTVHEHRTGIMRALLRRDVRADTAST